MAESSFWPSVRRLSTRLKIRRDGRVRCASRTDRRRASVTRVAAIFATGRDSQLLVLSSQPGSDRSSPLGRRSLHAPFPGHVISGTFARLFPTQMSLTTGTRSSRYGSFPPSAQAMGAAVRGRHEVEARSPPSFTESFDGSTVAVVRSRRTAAVISVRLDLGPSVVGCLKIPQRRLPSLDTAGVVTSSEPLVSRVGSLVVRAPFSRQRLERLSLRP